MTHVSPAALAEGVRNRQRRLMGKALSCVEAGGPEAAELLRLIHPLAGNSHIIGVTGSPGAGKSSLVAALIHHVRAQNVSIGVIAVDPSSPFSGGALLGDRVRMGGYGLDPNVFVRSLGSRGHAGGLSLAASLAAEVLDAAGFDVILLETAGVGQTELDIAQTADTTVLVLNPETGDDVQASKAGIMEIADVFVVNKADLPGAPAARAYVAAIEALAPERPWTPPILMTQAQPHPSGIEALWESLIAHRAHLRESGTLMIRRQRQLRNIVTSRLGDQVRRFLGIVLQEEALWAPVVQQVLADRTLDPLAAAALLGLQLPWSDLGRTTGE